MTVQIRPELPGDRAGVRNLLARAFPSPAEANLVEALRASGCDLVLFAAEQESEIVGHIAFSPVQLIGAAGPLRLMGLAPMAVLPELQNSGIGTLLVEAGLAACRERAYDAVVVLGHPHYYPRFGFLPASHYGVDSEYKVPDDTFMLLEFTPGALRGNRGRIQYHAAFRDLDGM